MKKQKEIIAGILIMVAVFSIGIIVALIVVNSDIVSKASNEGWLGFLGGLFGSFISGMITFYVLHINRKDMTDVGTKQQKISDIDKIEAYLKEAFNLMRIDINDRLPITDFLFISYMIEPNYYDTDFYRTIQGHLHNCEQRLNENVLRNEEETYKQFIEYRKLYIEGK